MSHDATRERIAANVRAEMARQQKLQSEAGELLDLQQQSISKRMLGVTPWRADELTRLAEWLGVPIAVLTAEHERVA